MTLSTTVNRISEVGTGSQVLWSYPYRINTADDIAVLLVDNTTNVETAQVLDTDYSVTLLGTPPEYSSALITMVTAPTTGETLIRYRDPDVVQETEFEANDPFPAETNEVTLDYLVMIDQRTRELLDQTIRVPESESNPARLEPLSTRASKNAAFDAAGNLIAQDLGSVTITDGDFLIFEKRSDIGLTNITGAGTTVNYLYTGGYTTAGDGGAAAYFYVASEPSHEGKVQSADGAWWEIDGANGVNVFQFGSTGDGVTDDAAAINNAILWADAQNAADVHIPQPASFYVTGSTINLKNNVKLIFAGAGGSLNTANYIRPTAAVTVAVYANLLKGYEVRNLAIDMQDMPASSSAIKVEGSWQGHWHKPNVFNNTLATHVCYEILSTAGQGQFWTVWVQPWAQGTGATPGTGYKLRGETSGPTKLTSQRFIQITGNGCQTGWDSDYTGQGVILDGVSFEGNLGDGMIVDNTTVPVELNGGEITSNGAWGITGSGNVLARDVVFSGNTTGNVDEEVYRYERGFLDGRSQTNLNAGDQINPTGRTVRVGGNGAPVTLTSNPQILAGTPGQEITLIGDDNTNTLTIVNGNGITTPGGANITLALADAVELQYNTSYADPWVVAAPPTKVLPKTFTITNYTNDQALDCDATSTAELADVLATLIKELQDRGYLRGTTS